MQRLHAVRCNTCMHSPHYLVSGGMVVIYRKFPVPCTSSARPGGPSCKSIGGLLVATGQAQRQPRLGHGVQRPHSRSDAASQRHDAALNAADIHSARPRKFALRDAWRRQAGSYRKQSISRAAQLIARARAKVKAACLSSPRPATPPRRRLA